MRGDSISLVDPLLLFYRCNGNRTRHNIASTEQAELDLDTTMGCYWTMCYGTKAEGKSKTDLPSAGMVDSMMRRPLFLASRSALTRLTVLLVMVSRIPLITMALSNLVSRSSPL